MRRVIILGLALSVFAAGLLPLSACALFSAKMAECPETATPSACDQMHPHSAPSQFSRNSDKSCCLTSQAPLPELQFKGVALDAAVALAVTHSMRAVDCARPFRRLMVVENSSPPSVQSLLCTFLI